MRFMYKSKIWVNTSMKNTSKGCLTKSQLQKVIKLGLKLNLFS